MNGHKTELFLLSLRLVGWFLLCIVTLGVGFIWFYPYALTAQLAFTNVSKARGWGQSSLIVTYHLPEDRTNSFWLVKGRKLNTRFFPPGFFEVTYLIDRIRRLLRVSVFVEAEDNGSQRRVIKNRKTKTGQASGRGRQWAERFGIFPDPKI